MTTRFTSISDLADIARELSGVLASKLAELRPLYENEPIRAVAIDLHPWDPVLEISILTVREVEKDPELLRDDEQASWAGYHASRKKGRLSKHPLAARLREQWNHTTTPAERRAIFCVAAEALMSEVVHQELERWAHDGEITVFVSDPDDPTCENLCAATQR